MAFDQSTRNRLQRFVTDARRTLEEEFPRQLQNDYGLDPISGTASPLESLRHINDQQRETARILRDTLAHYCASADTDTKATACSISVGMDIVRNARLGFGGVRSQVIEKA